MPLGNPQGYAQSQPNPMQMTSMPPPPGGSGQLMALMNNLLMARPPQPPKPQGVPGSGGLTGMSGGGLQAPGLGPQPMPSQNGGGLQASMPMPPQAMPMPQAPQMPPLQQLLPKPMPMPMPMPPQGAQGLQQLLAAMPRQPNPGKKRVAPKYR
jgi:hypothetical protein